MTDATVDVEMCVVCRSLSAPCSCVIAELMVQLQNQGMTQTLARLAAQRIELTRMKEPVEVALPVRNAVELIIDNVTLRQLKDGQTERLSAARRAIAEAVSRLTDIRKQLAEVNTDVMLRSDVLNLHTVRRDLMDIALSLDLFRV